MALAQSFLVLALAPLADALVQPRRLSGECNFTNTPETPYFWDPSCPEDGTSLGCLADGIHPQCRFCGEGSYSEVYCPASWCEFENAPHLPYYWDSQCSMGKVGCFADGENVNCRFCGEFPFNGTVQCPDKARSIVPQDVCDFENTPETPFFWDATCEDGQLGCKADGKHLGCRFCGLGEYAEVHCPASLCTFTPVEAASHRHYWEPQCWNASSHILGCLADGVHPECRFCGFGDYESIPCPAWAA